jgi:drug/metabolite transporter (DMT)-like permease
MHASSSNNLKTASLAGGGAIFGGIAGYAGMKLLMTQFHLSGKFLTSADGVALWLGIAFLGGGAMLAFVSTNRTLLARSMEGEGVKLPATNEEVRSSRLQAAVLALAGLMLLVPLFALHRIASHPAFARTVYAAIVLLFVVQTVLNIKLWRASDEFQRRTMLIVAAGTFAIGQALLFLWGAAERLGLTPGISGWDAIVLLMSCYMAVGFYNWFSVRLRLRDRFSENPEPRHDR